MKGWISQALRDLGIKYKLTLLILLLVILPFMLFAAVNSYFSSRETEMQARYSSQKVLTQTKAFLEAKTTSIKNEILSFSQDEFIRRLFITPVDYYQEDMANWIDDSSKFVKRTFTLYNNTDIAQTQLYISCGIADRMESSDFLKLDNIVDTEWYKDMIRNKSVNRWIPASGLPASGGKQFIHYMQGVKREDDVTAIIGIIKADIEEELLQSILNQAMFTKNTSVYLINSRNEKISTSTVVQADSDLISTVLAGMDAEKFDGGLWQDVQINRTKWLFGIQRVENTDWRLVMTVPYSDIMALSNRTRSRMLLILLVFIPLILPIAFLSASSGTKRVRVLISHMKEVEKGNFNVSILPSSQDEIGMLMRHFNHMLTRIAMLLDDTYRLGIENKNLELKALQAQINPHFLYNSLDLVNCLAIQNDVPDIRRMVDSLARFYKLSLSKGDDIVTIASELEHVRCYVQVQNMRFGEGIHLDIRVPEGLLEYRMPKIILQPIVENAILHGILKKEDESGHIVIDGKVENARITLTVTDDGVGMSAEKLAGLLSGDATNEFHGYGIKNIHERLVLHFGAASGLEYESSPDGGTSVKVQLPVE